MAPSRPSISHRKLEGLSLGEGASSDWPCLPFVSFLMAFSDIEPFLGMVSEGRGNFEGCKDDIGGSHGCE